MDFFYHPILGLQFTCGLSIYEIDLAYLPETNIEETLKLMFQKGINFINNNSEKVITEIHTEITTNAIL